MDVYHASLKEAQADPRLAALACASPFERLEWLALLAEECLDPAKAHVTAAVDGEGLAILPWRDAGGHVEALANWYNFFVKPCGDVSLFVGLVKALPHGRATFAPMAHDDADMLAAAFRKAGWIVLSEPCDANHVLPVNGRSFAEYWAARPGALRETVRRKGKKGDVSLRIATEFSDADWAAYEAVYNLSWKPGEGSPDFLRKWAQMDGAVGRLRLGIAEIGGEPVAAQFWTVEGGTAFIHKLAHDERYRKQSPGTLLTGAMFEHVIDRDRVDLVDFGTGDDPYKRDWMEAVRTRYRVRAWKPSAVRHWPSLLRAKARHLLQPLVSANHDG
ncbi:MAG: GNAT family N-acetyltransferase [Novosphingobium sp.]